MSLNVTCITHMITKCNRVVPTIECNTYFIFTVGLGHYSRIMFTSSSFCYVFLPNLLTQNSHCDAKLSFRSTTLPPPLTLDCDISFILTSHLSWWSRSPEMAAVEIGLVIYRFTGPIGCVFRLYRLSVAVSRRDVAASLLSGSCSAHFFLRDLIFKIKIYHICCTWHNRSRIK